MTENRSTPPLYLIAGEIDPASLTGATLDGRYHLEERLEADINQWVYRAMDVGSQRRVRLCLFLPPDLASLDATEVRLTRASRVRSPHVLRPVAIARTELGAQEALYAVTENTVVPPLAWAMRGGQGLPEADVLVVGLAVARALVAFDASSNFHGALDPDHIRFAPGSQEVVIDGLGCADTPSPERARLGDIGSRDARYAAPELARRQLLDLRSDVYSLGAVLYALLTGRAPYDDGQESSLEEALVAHSTLPLPQRALLRPSARSQALMDLALACLARSPEHRPAAGALLGQLENLTGQAFALPQATATPAPPTPSAQAEVTTTGRTPVSNTASHLAAAITGATQAPSRELTANERPARSSAALWLLPVAAVLVLGLIGAGVVGVWWSRSGTPEAPPTAEARVLHRLLTDPAGAAVISAGGEELGRTPFAYERNESESATLYLRLDGYETASVDLKRGSPVEQAITLQAVDTPAPEPEPEPVAPEPAPEAVAPPPSAPKPAAKPKPAPKPAPAPASAKPTKRTEIKLAR